MTEINPLAVHCPRCAARAGYPCRTTGGHQPLEPHRSRVKSAAEHQSAEELLDEILREAGT